MTDPVNAEDDLVERLRLQAERSSNIARQMAEEKSLRQSDNTERRIDLYMWPTPEQTVEGRAADRIAALEAVRSTRDGEIERLTAALKPFAEAWDEAQPYAEFDGRDCREGYLINAVGMSDFERARQALNQGTDNVG